MLCDRVRYIFVISIGAISFLICSIFVKARSPDSYSSDIEHTIGSEDNFYIKVDPTSPHPQEHPIQRNARLIRAVNHFIEKEDERIREQSKEIGEEVTKAFNLELNYFLLEDLYADWATHLDFATTDIEFHIRSLFNSSILVDSQSLDWESRMKGEWWQGESSDIWTSVQRKQIKNHWTPTRVEYFTQDSLLKAEYELQTMAFQKVNSHFMQTVEGVQNNIKALRTAVEQSYHVLKAPHVPLEEVKHISFSEYYDEHVTEATQKVLESKYTSQELALIQKPKTVSLTEVPYKFKAKEGDFLNKSQALYLKVYNVRPPHEQGQNAKILSLSALEVADEEKVLGQELSSNLAYQIGEVGSDIALGVTPYVGFGKDVYEALTGRHLLTGRVLTYVERTMSVMGIALSTVSGGTLSSGTLKTAFHTTNKTLGKIHQKALEKGGVFAQRGFEVVLDSSHKVLDILQTAGFRTKEGMKSAGYFLKRAFGKDTAGIEEVARTINIVQRSGVESYTHSLEELSQAGILLPREGEEFLARSLRFQNKLGLKDIDKAYLLRTGKTYSEFFENIDEVKPILLKETVWRALRKVGSNREGEVFFNNPENLFKPLSGSKHTSRRYSLPGEEGLYTSLSRKTAIKEVKASTKGIKLTDKQVEELYHIGSKDIEVDKVLDLTDVDTRKLFKVGKNTLTENDIATKIDDAIDAYELPQIIGHIAKRKGFKGIRAPSAPDKGKQNLVLLKELK